MIRFLLSAILLSVISSVSSQDFSNKGKDFFIAYPAHIDGTSSVMGIYITSDVNASGTIQVGPTATIPFTVTANQVTRKFIGSSGTIDASNSYVYLSLPDDVKTNAAIRITSDKPVVVYTHIIRSARSAATLALPTPVLGTEYIAPSHENMGGSASYGEIAVVATQPGTVIEVTPTIAGRGGRPANTTFQVTLPAIGDVYQFQGLLNGDISGTRIKSVSNGTAGCKPIAVFSATTWSGFDCTNASGGDNLYQQLFPLRTWGKKFITAPFINRPYDIYRIYVSDPTTVVTAKLQGANFPLNATNYNTTGKFYTIKTPFPVYIEADKPISVCQYIVSQTCKTGCSTGGTPASTCLADPEMVLLNPIEQTLNDVTFFSAHQNYVPSGQTQVTLHYVNLIIDKNYKSSVRVDNAAVPVGSFVDIPGTNYSYLQRDVTTSSAVNPVHRITADTSFSAIVYGYGNVESYGYNGGTNVRDLYQYVTLQNQFASVNFPATCKNTPFNFSITLPYQATSLTWDFNNNPSLTPNAQVVNNAPLPDSSFVRDGRTLYLYKLNGTYSFTNTGTYAVKVLANNPSPDGCTGLQEISYDVEVFGSPVANFSYTHTGCLTDSLKFSDSSNGFGRAVVKWQWKFGDNTIDTIKNPTKLYQTAGSFNVSLRAISDIGCVADTIKSVLISSKPIADFKVAGTMCPGSPITFTDTSLIVSGTIVKWYWNFGNGNVIVATNNLAPPQSYASPGNYTVNLQVESNTGCKSVITTKTITINTLPIVGFNLPGVCLPSGVAQFQNLSTSPDGSALTFVWTFGDGGTSTQATPVHVYTAPGPYSVQLQATSAFGCVKDSTIVFSNIFAQPKAVFTNAPGEMCVSDSMQFTDASTAQNNTVAQWFWDFGDGTTSNLQNPKKKFAIGGTYIVKLYIKSASGCISDTAQKSIVVHNLPTAAFTISTPNCDSLPVLLTSQSVANSGTLAAWFWDLGDSTTSTSSTPFTKQYPVGFYTIKLAVQNDKGCKSDTLAKTITISPQPRVNFILPVVCLSDAFALFTDSSFISDGTSNLFTYAWNFNDPNANVSNPNTSSVKNPQHKYSASGVYNVSLTVRSNNNCVATVVKPFVVNGAVPTAQFEVVDSNKLCSNTSVKIKNKSVVDFGSVTRLEIIWDNLSAPTVVQADVFTAFDKEYTHDYPALQVRKTYQIKVRAFSGGTCVNEKMKSITVEASPLVTFSTIPGICFDANPRQVAIPTNGGVTGSGIFSGTGVSTSGLFIPATAGVNNHSIRYVYTSNTGCKDSAEKSITVWPSPTAKWNFDDPTCIGTAITFRDSSLANYSNITQWNWIFAGIPDNRTDANPFTKTVSTSGVYNVSLQVVTDSGCKSVVLPKAIMIHPKPQVSFNLPAVCLPAGVANFTDLSTIADNTETQFSYMWDFGDPADPSVSIIKNPVHNYAALGPYTVQLKVTSVFGCKDSLSQQLTTVYPQPKADFTFSPTDTCLGGSINFTDQSNGLSGPATQWFWRFGDGGTNNLRNTSWKYAAARTYNASLYVVNQQGCVSDTATKQITIHPYPVVNAGPDLFVLEGDDLVLQPQITGNGLSYLWTPSNYLLKDTVKNAVTRPLADITYTIIATGTGGCKTSDQVFVKLLKSLGIPNAFSPNGDNVNDTWNIQYLENYPGATVEVFDRYGQQVHISYGYKKQWDGTFNGKILPVGTYYYIINPKNGRNKYSGSVTILR